MFTTLDDAIHGISVVIDATATVVAVNVGTGWFATVTAYDHVASFLDDGSEYPAIRGTATPAQIAEAIGVAV